MAATLAQGPHPRAALSTPPRLDHRIWHLRVALRRSGATNGGRSKPDKLGLYPQRAEGTTAVARVAVDVVIKPEILDPQGKAILAALGRTGHPGITSVRQGKHFDL